MQAKSATPTTPIEDLARQLYGLAMVQRDLGRHALEELGTQGFTALAVAQVHGPLRVGDVARRLRVDLSVASRQVAALADRGYVVRRADEDDRRAQVIAVTPEGRRALRESHRRMVEALSAALHAWDDADIASLAAGLQRLRDDYTRDEEEGSR